MSSEIENRARHVKLVLMDCDGVLTDGRLWLTSDGDEQKTFHVRDGQGIALLHRAGLKTGIISGRASAAVERRARDLNMSFVQQGANDKVAALEELLRRTGLSANDCAYLGDDVADIPVMRKVEFAVAVADAVEETKQAAHYVTEAPGGAGAIREVCELILKAQRLWKELMRAYDRE